MSERSESLSSPLPRCGRYFFPLTRVRERAGERALATLSALTRFPKTCFASLRKPPLPHAGEEERKQIVGVVLSLLGASLLLCAWRLSDLIPAAMGASVALAGCIGWIAAASLLILLHALKARRPCARVILALALFAVIAAPARTEYFRIAAAQWIALAGLAVLLAGLQRWHSVHPLLARLRRAEMPPPSACFALFLAATVTLSWYCFDFLPSYTDSTAQYVHAAFVASGHLYGIAGHPLHEFFPVWLMLHGATWYSQYPPLHQTLLGIMRLLDIPWLLNPLEGGLTLLALYAAARRAYGETAARIAALLTLASPFVLLMSSEYMNHASALLFTALLILSYGEWLISDGKKACLWALAAGLAAGCVFLTRPLTALGVGMPFILHATYRLWRDPRRQYAPFLAMAAGGALCVALQLWYNLQTTGDMLVYAYTRYHNNSLAKAMGYAHSGLSWPLLKAQDEWFRLNTNLFDWSLPCLLFILIPVRGAMSRLLLGMLLSQTFFNLFNQFHSAIFGPRYMYEAAAPLILLTAHAIRRTPALLAALGWRLPGGALAAALILVVATGLLGRFPARVRDYARMPDAHPEFYRSLLAQSRHPALIFVSRHDPGDKDPDAHFRWISWTYPPQSDAPVIFARDRGDAKNRELMNHYPERYAYVEQKGKLTPAP